MKTYLDLRATSALVQIELDCSGTVTIDGITKSGSTIIHWINIHNPFTITLPDNVKSVTVDNINITDYIQYNQINVNRPFYQWLHQITGQGWLLEP